MTGENTSKKCAWLAIASGEGSAEMRIVRSDREMVQFLWEQCGPDHTGNEESTRNYWYTYLENGDHWVHMDGLPRWCCSIGIGETGHVEFQLLHDGVLTDEPATIPDGPVPANTSVLDVLRSVDSLLEQNRYEPESSTRHQLAIAMSMLRSAPPPFPVDPSKLSSDELWALADRMGEELVKRGHLTKKPSDELERYRRALYQANGRLIQLDLEPVKLDYSHVGPAQSAEVIAGDNNTEARPVTSTVQLSDVIRSRAFWSDGRRDLLSVYVSESDISLIDDDGHVFEPAGDEQSHGPTKGASNA